MDKNEQLDLNVSIDTDSVYQDAECERTMDGEMQDEERSGNKSDPEWDSEPEVVEGGDLVSADDEESDASLAGDLDEMITRQHRLTDVGKLVCSTLASRPDGAEPNQLNTLMLSDWGINMELAAIHWFNYDSFAQLLASPDLEDYVEARAVHGERVVYGARVTPLIQHITQTIADEHLSMEQRKQKRKQQRLLELRKPENQATFIEGKRRILGILLDLKAFEEPVSFSDVQNEYMKRFGVCLNAQEQSRLFHNKTALKNLRNAFHKEIEVFDVNPMVIKLKSRNITMPTELSEEDRERAVGLGDVEVPVFRDAACDDNRDTHTRSTSKDRQTSNAMVSPAQPKKDNGRVTMAWDNEDASDSDDDNDKTVSGHSPSPSKTEQKTYYGGGGQAYTSNEESDDDSSYFEGESNAEKNPKPTKKNNHSVAEDKTVAARGRSEDSSPKDANGEKVREPRSKSSRRSGTTERALQRSIQQVRDSETEWRSPNASSPAPSSCDGYEVRRYATTNAMRGRDATGVVHENPFGRSRFADHEPRFRTNNEHHHMMLSDRRPSAPNNPQRYQNPGTGYDGTAHASGSRVRHSTSPRATTYGKDYFQRCGDDFPTHHIEHQTKVFDSASRPESAASHATRSYTPFSPPSSEFANRVNVATQTDDSWLDRVLRELGYIQEDAVSSSQPSSGFSPLRNVSGPDAEVLRLAYVVDMIVELHASKPVVLTDLPRLVESVYGTTINPVEDRRYRLSWKNLIERYCSRRVSLHHIEGHCDILLYDRD